MVQYNVKCPLPRRSAWHGLQAPLNVDGQEITVFTEPMAMMESLCRDARSARSRIWIEDYIVLDDWVGEELAVVLRQQASAGLDVRLMYDQTGSFTTSSRFFDDLRDSGVNVHAFHPVGRSLLKLQFSKANVRDHRRLFVIDDTIGYFGGMNIGDYGGPGSERPRTSKRSPVKAMWPDVHMRLVGSRQADLAAAFDAVWQREHGRQPTQQAPWQMESLLAPPADEVISFFASDPVGSGRSPEDVLVTQFSRAQQSLTLLVAYFVPQGPVLGALLAAAHRGVRVRLAVPAESDVKPVQFATRHIYRDLINHGIEVYERTGQMLHAKAIIVDQQWSMVGSSNIDPRSLWLNLEFFAVIRSAELGRLLETVATDEFGHSERITLEKAASRRWWQRLLDAIAWRFRRWL